MGNRHRFKRIAVRCDKNQGRTTTMDSFLGPSCFIKLFETSPRVGIATGISPNAGPIWTPIGGCANFPRIVMDGSASPPCLRMTSCAKFSGDRTVAECAAEVWNASGCPVP
jgi:hypothetical protein